VTIIGGQLLCLALSLLVVPVGYSLVEQARDWLARRQPKAASALPTTVPHAADR